MIKSKEFKFVDGMQIPIMTYDKCELCGKDIKGKGVKHTNLGKIVLFCSKEHKNAWIYAKLN